MKTVKLVCPSCSAEMEVDEEKNAYCGKKLQMDFPPVFKAGGFEWNTSTPPGRQAGWKVLIIVFLLSGLLLVGAEVGNMVHRANGEVKAPISGTEESLKDLDYEDASKNTFSL